MAGNEKVYPALILKTLKVLFLAQKPFPMMINVSRLLILLSLFLLSKIAYSDTFTVTSNADNGPGTLREAIASANANGTVTVDYIHFNMANTTPAGRTITLLSYLPALTSNIVLDASTQPCASFGVSSAKVRITTNGSETYSQCFILRNVENIEPSDVFIWMAKGKDLLGDSIESKGTVMLVR